MADFKSMMILSVESRRLYFRQAYALYLGKLHASGACVWPIERLPVIVETVMFAILEKKQLPTGTAINATKKFFGMKADKDVFTFLELN